MRGRHNAHAEGVEVVHGYRDGVDAAPAILRQSVQLRAADFQPALRVNRPGQLAGERDAGDVGFATQAPLDSLVRQPGACEEFRPWGSFRRVRPFLSFHLQPCGEMLSYVEPRIESLQINDGPPHQEHGSWEGQRNSNLSDDNHGPDAPEAQPARIRGRLTLRRWRVQRRKPPLKE